MCQIFISWQKKNKTLRPFSPPTDIVFFCLFVEQHHSSPSGSRVKMKISLFLQPRLVHLVLFTTRACAAAYLSWSPQVWRWVEASTVGRPLHCYTLEVACANPGSAGGGAPPDRYGIAAGCTILTRYVTDWHDLRWRQASLWLRLTRCPMRFAQPIWQLA